MKYLILLFSALFMSCFSPSNTPEPVCNIYGQWGYEVEGGYLGCNQTFLQTFYNDGTYRAEILYPKNCKHVINSYSNTIYTSDSGRYNLVNLVEGNYITFESKWQIIHKVDGTSIVDSNGYDIVLPIGYEGDLKCDDYVKIQRNFIGDNGSIYHKWKKLN